MTLRRIAAIEICPRRRSIRVYINEVCPAITVQVRKLKTNAICAYSRQQRFRTVPYWCSLIRSIILAEHVSIPRRCSATMRNG